MSASPSYTRLSPPMPPVHIGARPPQAQHSSHFDFNPTNDRMSPVHTIPVNEHRGSVANSQRNSVNDRRGSVNGLARNSVNDRRGPVKGHRSSASDGLGSVNGQRSSVNDSVNDGLGLIVGHRSSVTVRQGSVSRTQPPDGLPV